MKNNLVPSLTHLTNIKSLVLEVPGRQFLASLYRIRINMSRITVTKKIDAPVERVFKTVADIRNFSKAVPDIVNVEFLSEQKSGVGTRFRETREMNGREESTELEVTEYSENDRIRLVADSHGTVWDSVFTVEGNENSTKLTLVMDAKAYKFLPKLMNPVMKYFIKKALRKDMDAVKSYCEA